MEQEGQGPGGGDGEGATGSGDWLAGGMSSAHAQRMRHRPMSDHQTSVRGIAILPENGPCDVDYAPRKEFLQETLRPKLRHCPKLSSGWQRQTVVVPRSYLEKGVGNSRILTGSGNRKLSRFQLIFMGIVPKTMDGMRTRTRLNLQSA